MQHGGAHRLRLSLLTANGHIAEGRVDKSDGQEQGSNAIKTNRVAASRCVKRFGYVVSVSVKFRLIADGTNINYW
ncbi:hypothetical protein GW17_00051097 [Ensete ventricosum]|nr:hypothetical protein GW17_00051097 [Ensete ventricosum]